jgi:hypothetical protein
LSGDKKPPGTASIAVPDLFAELSGLPGQHLPVHQRMI